MNEAPDSARPLAEMLGDVPPEHDLRGRLLVLGIYAAGAVFWATVVFEGNSGWGERLGWFVAASPVFVCASIFARAVERFTFWSWFVLAVWLGGFLVAGVAAFFYGDLSQAEAVSAAAAVMMTLGGLHYLWLRRRDFWADLRVEHRRPAPRAVTPEWRAARLASIGTQSVCARRRVSPRPGALWIRRTRPAQG
jgi:hypothetical protein